MSSLPAAIIASSLPSLHVVPAPLAKATKTASGKNPAAWSTTRTNHREARELIMGRVLAYMGQRNVVARRATEGVTHILKGAVYLPGFDSIPVPAGVSEEKARGLRKGMLWGTAMACAGITVPADVVAPELPQHLAAMVMVCAVQIDQHLTPHDKATIAAIFAKHAGPKAVFVKGTPPMLDAQEPTPMFEGIQVKAKALVAK